MMNGTAVLPANVVMALAGNAATISTGNVQNGSAMVLPEVSPIRSVLW